jgi:hypothetical protein
MLQDQEDKHTIAGGIGHDGEYRRPIRPEVLSMISIVSQELWSSTINKCSRCAADKSNYFRHVTQTSKGQDYLPRVPDQETIKAPDDLKRAFLRQKTLQWSLRLTGPMFKFSRLRGFEMTMLQIESGVGWQNLGTSRVEPSNISFQFAPHSSYNMFFQSFLESSQPIPIRETSI